MFDQLKVYQNKEVVLELVNGRTISGKVLSVDQKFVRMETEEGVGTIPVEAVQIIWEPAKRSLTQKDMDNIAQQMRESVNTKLVCYPNGFQCANVYNCLPPHFCYPGFTCGGGGFSQAGGPPGCTTNYQCYGQFAGIQCTPPGFASPMSYNSNGEQVSGQTYCQPFTFGPSCVPYQFAQTCYYPFLGFSGPYQAPQKPTNFSVKEDKKNDVKKE